jgi:hypothetical protein
VLVEVDGVSFSSASDAANAIVGKRTNGWSFFLTDQASRQSLQKSGRRTHLWTIHRSRLPTGRMPRQYVLGAGPVEAPVAELPARLCPAPLTAAASSLRMPPIAASRVSA